MITDNEARLWREFANTVVDIAEGNVSGARGLMSNLKTNGSYNKRTEMIRQAEADLMSKLELIHGKRWYENRGSKYILDSVRNETWDTARASVSLTQHQRALVSNYPLELTFSTIMLTDYPGRRNMHFGNLSTFYQKVLRKGLDFDDKYKNGSEENVRLRDMSVVYATMFANCINDTVSDMMAGD